MPTNDMHPELRWTIQDVAQQARRLRRMRCAWRFALATLGCTALATALFTLDLGVTGTRVVGIAYVLAVLAAAGRWLVWPLRRRITLEQVARYIDEHHPELQDRVVSAVDFAEKPSPGASPWIVEQFMAETIPLVQKTSFDDVTRGSRAQALFMVATFLFLAAVIIVVEFRGYWTSAWSWVLPSEMAARVLPLPFTVEPGDARVRKGDNAMVWVRSDEPDRAVTLQYRIGDGVWQEATARASQTEQVHFHEFRNIQDDVAYRVQYGRRVSDDYTLTAWLPPEVAQINLTYRYPDYLEREPREEPNAGHIAAVEGTVVEISALVNKELAEAAMVLDTGERIALAQSGPGLWSVPYTVEENAKYRIELRDLEGESSEYNPEYRITAQQDLPPKVAINFPRSDQEVTRIDSVPFTFAVSDDFGFRDFGLQYEVAGREPVRLSLSEGEGQALAADGNYELMLEDMDLETGDFITWTIWARDAKPDRSEWEELGDPYFLEIRPFERTFREAVSDGGGQQQQGGGGQGGELAQAQKEILIATWNLRRDIRFHDEDSFREDRDVIAGSQQRLLDQVSMGGGEGGDAATQRDLAALKDAMARSVDSLKRATMPDPRGSLSEATSAQQLANRLILKMEPPDAQVSQQQGGGGGGGGGMARDAELQQLEMSRNRNFYQNERMTQEQQQATDEVLQQLKALAQRQQSVNEELAKLISEMQNASPEEQERIRRRLERLKEEMRQNMERLDEARREMANQPMNTEQSQDAMDQLDWARRQMNDSLERMNEEDLQRARASAGRALRSMDEVAEQLRQLNRSAAAERMRNIQEQMEDLLDQQRANTDRTREAKERHDSPSLTDVQKNAETKEEVLETKEAMTRQFLEMMDDAADLAERSRESQELMARNLGDWLRETAKEGLLEELEESRDLARYDLWDRALREEAELTEKFRTAARRLDEVAESLVQDDLAAMQEALRRLDELMERPEMQGAGAGQQQAEGEPGSEDERERMARAAGGEEGDEQARGEGDARGSASSEDLESEESQRGGAPGEESEESQRGPGEGEESDEAQRGSGEGEGTDEAQRGSGEDAGERERMARRAEGEQPREGESGGQQPGRGGEQTENEDPSGRPSEQAQRSPGQRGGDQRSGDSSFGGFDDLMRNFAEDGYREWVENLRDAEDLLPPQSPVRQQIAEIRERVEMMRRNWRNRSLPPQWDLFLEVAARPLEDASGALQREIEKQLGAEEFVITDDGAVPERYQRRVAEYFRSLSEAEGVR